MGYLAHRDVNSLHECIRRIYSNSDINTFHAHALSAVSQVVPSTIASYNEVCPRKKERTKFITTDCSAVTKETTAAFSRYMYEHPYINFLYPKTMQSHPFRKRIEKFRQAQKIDWNHFPKSRAVKISDMLTQSQFRRLALYNEYYKKLDTNFQLILPLCYSRDMLSGFAFNRDKRDFTEEERLIFNLLAPHLIQAYQNAEAAYKARQEAVVSIKNLEPFGLTPREAEVLHWLACGKTNGEIASICAININTVKKHLEKTYRKLGVQNRTGALMLAHSLPEAR